MFTDTVLFQLVVKDLQLELFIASSKSNWLAEVIDRYT